MPQTAEHPDAVTMKGNPKTLVGPQLKVGDKAPDFTLVAPDMSQKTLGDFTGKVKIIAVVPSLDTPVCDTEIQRFNNEATKLSDDVVIIPVSIDTPMAQKRWCGHTGADQIHPLSDFRDHAFGVAYGVRIKELGLLARTVIVVDQNDVVRHIELVKEVADQPDYDAALAVAKKLA